MFLGHWTSKIVKSLRMAIAIAFPEFNNLGRSVTQKHILFTIIIVNKICFWVTEHPRLLNPGKAIAMAIRPIIVHIIT